MKFNQSLWVQSIHRFEDRCRNITCSCSISHSAGKSARFVAISAIIVATDHTSTLGEYVLDPSSNSGARYHRVTTCSTQNTTMSLCCVLSIHATQHNTTHNTEHVKDKSKRSKVQGARCKVQGRGTGDGRWHTSVVSGLEGGTKALASPKSAILSVPSLATSRLCGLRSLHSHWSIGVHCKGAKAQGSYLCITPRLWQ